MTRAAGQGGQLQSPDWDELNTEERGEGRKGQRKGKRKGGEKRKNGHIY